jgi:hypothetical protein
MKNIVAIFILSCPLALNAQKEGYEKAYTVLADMLTGKQPLDFIKAVYTLENAYLEDTLSYVAYTKKIKDIANVCKGMIAKKGLQKYKTAGNWAIFMWMTQKIPENDSLPCNYDFEDFLGLKKYSNTFVWRLLTEKKGNCLSLPLLYKMVSSELKVEARLTIGPNHAWIRHVDEKGKWINVELTSGQFPSDGFLMTSLGITTTAIKSGAYSTPLTEKEAVAYLLTQLAQGYEAKFNRLDAFTEKCCDLSIRYFPSNATAYMLKANEKVKRRDEVLQKNGGIKNQFSDKIHQEYMACQAKLDAFGVTQIAPEDYNKWVEETKKRKQ